MNQPFDIDLVIERVGEAVRPYPKAALFELADDGFRTTFEQLVACLISIRTLDEVTLPTARQLFARARTAGEIAALSFEELNSLIHNSAFHEGKARQIQAIARRVEGEFGGALPGDEAILLSLPGVGPKCANLVLGIAGGQPKIAVDIHVHRVTNRWGYVNTTTPETTLAALAQKLPKQYWVEINRVLVPFGKHVCTGRRPACSTCPVLAMCQQVDVLDQR